MHRLILLALLSLADLTVQGSALRCDNSNTMVFHDDNSADAKAACVAAKSTTAFMQAHGFNVDTPLTIEIVDGAVEAGNAHLIGKYDAMTSAVTISAFRYCCQFLAQHRIFGEDVSRELYSSFIVHEIAHAIAQNSFRVPRPSVAAHEYIAYVVQLATMDEALRGRILSRFDNEAFTKDQEISEPFFALGPQIFAVKAYRHFIQRGHGGAFFQRLLKGEFQSPPTH